VLLPNFLVIGAAKAGTTSLYWYLAEHPAVFMIPAKQSNFFGYGVDENGRLLYGDPEVHKFPIRTLPDYERLFDGAGTAQAVGEASPIYLECPQAAARIRATIPRARIIACLRHPVERAYSDYLMELRHRGRQFDPARDLRAGSTWARPDSRWMQVGRYGEQLARYYDAFPKEQIHVFLFDDLQKNALSVVQDVYRFLGVDPSFVPDVETPHNTGGLSANRFLERVLTSKVVIQKIKPWVPSGAVNWARRLRTRTLRRPPPPLPRELRRELTSHVREDILRTSDLIGRSLDHWL
jgi:sulfotransferase family protein